MVLICDRQGARWRDSLTLVGGEGQTDETPREFTARDGQDDKVPPSLPPLLSEKGRKVWNFSSWHKWERDVIVSVQTPHLDITCASSLASPATRLQPHNFCLLIHSVSIVFPPFLKVSRQLRVNFVTHQVLLILLQGWIIGCFKKQVFKHRLKAVLTKQGWKSTRNLAGREEKALSSA